MCQEWVQAVPQEMSFLIERQMGQLWAGVPGLPGSSSLYIGNIEAFTLCPIYDGRCFQVWYGDKFTQDDRNLGTIGLISNLKPVSLMRELTINIGCSRQFY